METGGRDMKKKAFVLLWLSAFLLLAGCQNAQVNQPDIPLTEAARQAMADPDAYIPYTADDLYDMIGISPDDYTEAVFFKDKDTLSGREIILVRGKDAQSIPGITKALEQYLSQRKEETRNYLPNAYRLLCDAAVQASGLTVSLIIQ